MSESRGTINGTFGENGDTPAQTLMGGGEFRSDAHKEITALRQTGAGSPFLSALPPGAEDGRGTSPSLRDTLAVSPFDHAVPAAFGGWHRTLNTVSALISFVRDKWINRLGVFRQEPVLPNVFEYISTEFPYVDPALDGRGEYYDFQIRGVENARVHGSTMNQRSNDNHAKDGKILTLGGKRD